jgi:murein DD-endopeptidase MepM/ murein hydrolase activator NlpD
MSFRKARAIAYGVVALLGVAAVFLTSPLPPAATQPAGEVLSKAHTEHRWRERHDTLGRGESLVSVLARGGVTEVLAREAVKGLTAMDPRRIRVGTPVLIRSEPEDTMPTEITLQVAVDRLLHLKRTPTGWVETDERLPWHVDTVVINAVIKSNLYAAVHTAAREVFPDARVREELTRDLADVMEYRVDMSRDLQVGDQFRVVVQRLTGPQGITRVDSIIAATMKLSGVTTEAIRFRSARVPGEFFDAKGAPLKSGFLRNPVSFRRISSGFGMRRHPILGTMRKHQGTDYAANAGTPIRAIGDGVVIRANFNNGYGNVVEIRHPNGYVSRYGHMRGFASGIHGGARVNREQTIGYVGSTGLSTAPHLHFEVLVGGVQRNPRSVLQNASSEPIPASEREAFSLRRMQTLAMLESARYLASADLPTGRAQ